MTPLTAVAYFLHLLIRERMHRSQAMLLLAFLQAGKKFLMRSRFTIFRQLLTIKQSLNCKYLGLTSSKSQIAHVLLNS